MATITAVCKAVLAINILISSVLPLPLMSTLLLFVVPVVVLLPMRLILLWPPFFQDLTGNITWSSDASGIAQS